MVGAMQTSSTGGGGTEPDHFMEIWAHNLDEGFDKIRLIVQKYPYIAMDTEFPGVVAKPIGEFRSPSDYQYQLLKCNVNMLKLIQLGLTFYNDQAESPPGLSTFQFNFKFSLGEDMYAQDSIDMLTGAGIQFKRHEEEGVDVNVFAELLISSGLVLNNEVTWTTFASGYDFGYLLRVLTCVKLPDKEQQFFELLSMYFPKVYDVKYLMKSCKNLKGGLQEVADNLELERAGTQHQAGSDSYLTGAAFFRMKQMFFDDNIDEEKYCGYLFGLGNSYSSNSTTTNGNNGYSASDPSQ